MFTVYWHCLGLLTQFTAYWHSLRLTGNVNGLLTLLADTVYLTDNVYDLLALFMVYLHSSRLTDNVYCLLTLLMTLFTEIVYN